MSGANAAAMRPVGAKRLPQGQKPRQNGVEKNRRKKFKKVRNRC
jgi:hypothetical protein